MTVPITQKLKCQNCGHKSEHSIIISTSAVGSPDLDGRPPEVQRSTIDMWIQECPSCGYCSPDISENVPNAGEIVASEEYKNQLIYSGYPSLANRFLRWSMIAEKTGQLVAAVWASIHAAWVCDDSDADSAAQKCRREAADLLQKAMKSEQKIAEQAGLEDAILVDLLRRSNQFEKALLSCDTGLSKGFDDVIKKVLEYQKHLISKQDAACHTIAEAIGESENSCGVAC